MKIIDWKHYRLLLAIRDIGTLTAAAKALGLTQSAASHQVREAERRLGVELVLRRGRSLELTRAGELLAEAAAACTPVLLDAETKAREANHSGRQRLRIAFGPQDGLRWAADAASYLAATPDPLQLDLIAADRGVASRCLRSGLADLALEIGAATSSEFRGRLIAQDELVCVFAPGHPLSATASVTAESLAGETYFAHSLVPQAGFELEAFFQPAVRRPVHVAQIQSLHAIVDLVAAGQGVTIQPRSAVASELREGRLATRSLAPTPIFQPWYLLIRPGTIGQPDDDLIAGLEDTIRPHFQPPASAYPDSFKRR